MSGTMRAAMVTADGVKVQEAPRPAPGPEEVLVRVRAATLNRADLGVAAGGSHGAMGGAGTILGLDFAGEVAAVGSAVTGVKPGDRVTCSGAGGYAEYAIADMARVQPVPDRNMSWEEAATLPVALATMHDAIVMNGRLAKGDSVMILGASSGVGIMGMQIAKFMGASLVVGTSTDAARRARLKEFGADVAVNTRDADWADQVLAATGGKGVNLVVDQVSAATINAAMRCTAILGRIVNVGRLGGAKGEFDFDLHATRRIAYIGVTHRTRSREEIRAEYAAMRRDLWEAVEQGRFSIPIDRAFPLDQVAEALAHMKANRHFGKIVLSV
ncbi:zinc-binding dehydrogenase [Roseomonas sp. CECT 9278]|uniref:zinc-binding dehydrogenase n=1 Tax=Roseomonas sp. CECT 9278 TaxID=2845823 RepID=UPI001E2E426D|nr:zinc-binding dehydrogenase [Roseomonas sp. CECT 9278]CAH0275688.1 Phthiocerol synthesis polyketide synthase type I PpsC [Roseomonas sp. CECT 9278]